MSFVRPTFQPQNPAINGYYLGWASCTCYAGAMAASYDRQVKMVIEGEDVRRRTGDVRGGTTLAQVDAAVRSLTGVDLDVRYRMPWSQYADWTDAGRASILQGWYAPIADSTFNAGNGFRQNHAFCNVPDWHALDPLADGRYSGVYKYRNQSYPKMLLRDFAGDLNIAESGYRKLGRGYVYAAFTKDRVSTYSLHIEGGQAFYVYQMSPDGTITSRSSHAAYSDDTSAPCSMPIFYRWPGHSGKMLVRVLRGGLAHEYVDPNQSATSLEEYP